MAQQQGELTELPKSLQIDNAIMACALTLNPIWYASMLWADARDRRRRKWRIPKAPATLGMYCVPGLAPIQLQSHL